MRHLILCREYPPAVYPPGGIGSYVTHIARVLADMGETVHVIGQRWEGASKRKEVREDGRLVIHRIAPEDADAFPALSSGGAATAEVAAMLRSDFPAQWFSRVAAGLAERLVEEEGIDVIEAQEWEAPLYHFLLRRSLGLGPQRTPPCITHLHSPTEFIFRHNDWSLSRPEYLTMKRMEDHVIRAADGLICPSRYLAAECRTHYGLPEAVEVIPLPRGPNGPRARSPETWETGPVTFVGRLEPRKGVIEFADAAVELAAADPALRFGFVGSDNEYNGRITVRELIERRIPQRLRPCFTFHGNKDRDGVIDLLGRSRIAVVPSRWENFPNTCVEAMSSGLPVVATRNGGMAEMIEDGVTGWLAEAGTAPLSDRLASTLRRALSAPPDTLAAMGARAAQSISALCDNQTVGARHIAFRDRVRKAGADRSLRLPAAYPWPHLLQRPVGPPVPTAESGGTAVAVIAARGRNPAPALESLAAQSRPPAAVVVVSEAPAGGGDHLHVAYPGTSRAVARSLAIEAVPDAARWVFLDADTTLAPDAIGAMEAALDRAPEAGLVSVWTEHPDGRDTATALPPSFPQMWLQNEIGGPAMYRTAALIAAGGFRPDIARGHEEWDRAAAIMASGWAAQRIPVFLARIGPDGSASEDGFGRVCHAAADIAARFPHLAGADAVELVRLAERRQRPARLPSGGPASATGAEEPPRAVTRTEIQSLGWVLRLPLKDQAKLVALGLKRPDWAARWLLWRAKSQLEKWSTRRDR